MTKSKLSYEEEQEADNEAISLMLPRCQNCVFRHQIPCQEKSHEDQTECDDFKPYPPIKTRRMAKCPACCKTVEFINGTHECKELAEPPYNGGFAYILEDMEPRYAESMGLYEHAYLIGELSKRGLKDPLWRDPCQKED